MLLVNVEDYDNININGKMKKRINKYIQDNYLYRLIQYINTDIQKYVYALIRACIHENYGIYRYLHEASIYANEFVIRYGALHKQCMQKIFIFLRENDLLDYYDKRYLIEQICLHGHMNDLLMVLCNCNDIELDDRDFINSLQNDNINISMYLIQCCHTSINEALIYACIEGKILLVKSIIKCYDAKYLCNNCFMNAIYYGHNELVDYLIEVIGDINNITIEITVLSLIEHPYYNDVVIKFIELGFVMTENLMIHMAAYRNIYLLRYIYKYHRVFVNNQINGCLFKYFSVSDCFSIMGDN